MKRHLFYRIYLLSCIIHVIKNSVLYKKKDSELTGLNLIEDSKKIPLLLKISIPHFSPRFISLSIFKNRLCFSIVSNTFH